MRRLFHRSSNQVDDHYGLEVLYTPHVQADQDEVAIQVDIIAVHGLNGHRRNTWTYVDDSNGHAVLWLNELLPQHIPQARIMTFGYKANVFGNTSTDGIGDTARTLLSELLDRRDSVDARPIVLIGHSLGGLIIKRALRIAKNENYFESISKDVKGIMFFGTPHQGANVANWANVATRLVRAAFLKPKVEFIKALMCNSEALTELTDDFVPLADEYAIVSFWEGDYLPSLGSVVVPKHSALLNLPWEVKRSLRGDHRSMCRFSRSDDPEFEAVWKAIRNIISGRLPSGGANVTLAESESRGLLPPESHAIVFETDSTPRNTFWTIQRSSSPVFTGRNHILERLARFFFPEAEGSREGLRPRRVSLLYGLGGSGKSQICLRFCEVHRQRIWGVFWIDARSSETVEHSYAEIARAVGAKEQTSSAAKKLLSTCEREWLLIIDGADDPTIDVSKYFPLGSIGSILISSRNQECRRHAPHAYYDVDKMLPNEATSLLFEAGLVQQSLRHTQWAQAALIVQELGYFALAIDQAGSFIANGCRLGDFLTKYQHGRKRLLNERPQQGAANYECSVYTTWEMSFQAVQRKSAVAAAILEHFSILHYDRIPKDIFRRASNLIRNLRGTSDREEEDSNAVDVVLLDPILGLLQEDSKDAEWDDYDFEEAIRILCSYSLVKTDTYDEEPVYFLHPLVHSWARERLPGGERLATKISAAFLLGYSISQTLLHEAPSFSTFRFQRIVLPHVESCRRVFTELSTRIPGQEPSYAFAMLYSELNMWKDVEELFVDITTTRMQVHGPEHPATLASMETLAHAYSEQGQKEGRELLEQVVSTNKKVIGSAHADTLLSMKSLAVTYLEDQLYDEAKDVLEKVLEAERRVTDDESADILATIRLQATVYVREEDWQNAEELLVRLKNTSERVLGEEHGDTLDVAHELAYAYAAQKKWQEAEKLFLEVMEAREKVFGPQHPDTLISADFVGLAYRKQGKFKQAEELLTSNKRMLALEHLGTLVRMSPLSQGIREQGRRREAQELELEIIDARRKMSDDHNC